MNTLEVISNTSPLLYLYRINAIDWLPQLFSQVWTTSAVRRELREGQQRGYQVPRLEDYPWLRVVEPQMTMVPVEWLSLELGAGELTAMALALEETHRIVLLDDGLARRVAKAAGLTVWGTLKILLQAKSQGLTGKIAPLLQQLEGAGLWMSDEIVQRVLVLAGE